MNTDVKLADAKATAARAFVRSLNILLKFARLYGFKHTRTFTQFETTWNELRAAVSSDRSGLLLGAAGAQLLMDGVPVEASATERSFCQLLSAAGLASIFFSPQVTQEDLVRFAQAFPTGNAQPTALAEQLKAALAGAPGIRINEIRFVAEDSALSEAKMAAQLTARALGADSKHFKEWMNDPQKLLQLIVAAEGSKGGAGAASGPGRGGSGGGPAIALGGAGAPPTTAGLGATAGGLLGGVARTGPGLGAPDTGEAGGSTGQEDELQGILRLFSRLGQLSSQPGATNQPGLLQQQVSELPERAQVTLRQALASLSAHTPDRPNEPMLVKLAEHLAIRFALDRFERGEVRVNAVRQMLDRMSQELEGLRKVLGVHEEKMARAGMLVESHADILDRQFWASVPESGKRSVLLSPEAWCIPPRNLRQYVEELLKRGDKDVAQQILSNYSSCINNSEAEARRKTAAGLSELAELYGSDAKALVGAIRQAGAQLSLEREGELQSLVSAAFVRLAQEAAMRHCYSAMHQTMDSLDAVENQRPAFAQSLRPRIGVEDRLPEFIEEALRAERAPEGLPELLRLMPRPATDRLMTRFNRSTYRQDCDRLVALARELGPDGVSPLHELLRVNPAAEAVETVGLLSRLDPAAVEQWLTRRVREFQRAAHDRMVRLLSAGGAPERGRLLLVVLDKLDPLIMPLGLDEIGMSGDASLGPQLVPFAEGELPELAGAYVQLKAIEALGRLRERSAVDALRRVAEAKHVWRWTHASELRIAAVQALEKINPEWTRSFLPHSGLDQAELAGSLAPLDPVADCPRVRQRRYARIRLAQPLVAVATSPRETCRLEIRGMSLSGGVAGFERHMAHGTLVTLKIGGGLRSIRAQAMVRDARTLGLGFEFLDMALEDRTKLRRLLASDPGASRITPASTEQTEED